MANENTHSLSSYVKFSEKLTFLNTRAGAYQEVRNACAYVLSD